MKYTAKQTFETLGDPCSETFPTIESAEAAADILSADLAAMVAGWEIPEDDSPTGFGREIEAWEHARELSDGGQTYGQAAGEYIAGQAVEILEAE